MKKRKLSQGASMIEYALVLTLITVITITAFQAFGAAPHNFMSP